MADSSVAEKTMEAYLKELSQWLRGISPEEASEIIAELRGFFLERAGHDGALSSAGVESVIDSLGPPDELARKYSTTSQAGPDRTLTPSLIAQGPWNWAGPSAWGVIACCATALGYFITLFCLLVVGFKLFNSQGTGVWWQSHPVDASLFINHSGQLPAGREILGWSLIPCGLCLAVGMCLFTSRFALWSLKKSQRRIFRLIEGYGGDLIP